MAGKPGRSGTNRNKEKPWADALRLAVNEGEGDAKKLRRLATVVVDAAIAGDMQAAKEIGDRLDGKPAQPVVGDDDADPINVVNRIEIVAAGVDSPG